MKPVADWLSRIALTIASVALTLCLVECGMWVAGVAPLPDTAAGGFRPEHPLLRLLEPDKCGSVGSAEGVYLIEVCTNAKGLRDRDHAADESPRVLGLGDSFTFGWGVAQSDTFLAHLERGLRLALPSRRPGVWGAGLSYTSQAHQDVLLRHIYDDVRPDLVVLAFSEDNDIDENIVWNPNVGVFPETGEIPREAVDAYRDSVERLVFDDWLFRHSRLVRLARQRRVRASVVAEAEAIDARLRAHGLEGAPLAKLVADEGRRRFLQAFTPKNDGDWSVTELLLERIRRQVEDRRGKLVLLRIPSRRSVDDREWQEAVRANCGADPAAVEATCGAVDRAHTASRLEAYAAEKRLVYVDPSADLGAAADRGEQVYLAGDIHLGRLGHDRVGARLTSVVLRELGAERPAAAEQKAQKQRLVGAYYYPWYRSRDWGSFTDYTPVGGAYVSTEPAAIARQLQAADRGEIDFFIIELLAPHNPEAKFNDEAVDAVVSAIVERRKRGFSNLRFAVLSDIFLGEANIVTPEKWLEVTRSQLDDIWKRFVEPHRDAYAHVGGKPLVGIYSPPVVVDDPRYTVLRPYWVSHPQWEKWERKSDLVPFWDTTPQVVTDRRFVSVTPGYNDWRLERQPQVAPYFPRRGGKTFIEQWKRVFEVDPEVVLVYSFNEYFEQTQIEPTLEQGDRYLLLNQILARRYKDGATFAPTELERLADVIEPRARSGEERAHFTSIDDETVTRQGFARVEGGRAEFALRGELRVEVDSPDAFIIGLAHEPTYDRCAAFSVTPKEGEAEATPMLFRTELNQLAVLRDAPQSKGSRTVSLTIERIKGHPDCADGSPKPIVFTGITRYPLPTSERRNFRVHDSNVALTGFWDIEKPEQETTFVWSSGRSTVTVAGLDPGARHRATLTFRDTANFGNVQIGPDAEHLESVVITPGRTVTLATPITVGDDGKLRLTFETPVWRPSKLFNSKDERGLGVALRLITLDRVEDPGRAHGRR